MDFLNRHNKLSPYQHGFQSAHSCQTQLLETVHHWVHALEKRLTTNAIFLDFSKAFDKAYHLNNTPLELVKEYTYLGINITSNLSWHKHISAKAVKANSILNLLQRTMHGCSKKGKKRAYEALVRPQVEYCSPP